MLGSLSFGASRMGTSQVGRRFHRPGGIAVFLAALILAGTASSLVAADLAACRDDFRAGRYRECHTTVAKAVDEGAYGTGWRTLKARCELATGRYAAAAETVKQGLERYSWSIRLRLLGHEAALHTGHPDRAREFLEEIDRRASRMPWRYTDSDELVTLGEAALLMGADAREVLETFYDRARRQDPDDRRPYLATGRLALKKHDFAFAADTFREALKKFPDDPALHFGLARALAESDPEHAQAALDEALDRNPRYVPGLLFQADRLLESERYDKVEGVLGKVFEVNPRHPRAWAFRAVLANLRNDPKGEAAFRTAALSSWPTNPAVDHLIGRELSQKYRFAEGAAYQRRALAFDDRYLPARIQLSQDLLRLGQEEKGWELAAATHDSDGYDVVTFNLLELRDRLDQFTTLENDDFIVRMDAHEAAVYGDRVLALLGRAKRTLCEKYGLQLDHPVTVEIFPDENDFAVRTFGMPATSGYLGVCFGKVITANSPASQADHPSNWEAVLWHEFCHVVTLEITRNKMPRWLSEGISVYEERQRNPAWGQRMNPRYRRMVLSGELTPISELSSAFLAPESPAHLQFAYYESNLVVEYLVEEYGFEALRNILGDLGAGLPINTALQRHTVPLGELEGGFEKFARRRAEQLAPNADWKQPLPALLSGDAEASLARWLKSHPDNIPALKARAQELMAERRWKKAKRPLTRLRELYPGDIGPENATVALARIHRELGDTAQEPKLLEDYAAMDADAVHVYLRLLELHAETENRPALRRNARRAIAVNPLLPRPYRALAEAAEAGDVPEEAIAAYRTLLELEPGDPALVHYRLARLLEERRMPAAKRHILQALEAAPRFRKAHDLLLKITRRED